MNLLPAGSSHFVQAGNVVLHARADGVDEGPVVAFINSLGSDMRIWDGVVSRLPVRSIRHDLRGHGLSEAPPGPYTITDMANDLHRLIDIAGVKSVVLAGVSVGGLVALRYALEWPDEVTALVILDSAARIGNEESWNQRIATVERDGIEAIAEQVVTRWFSRGFPDREPAVYAGHLNMLKRTPVSGYAATCAALRDEDLRGRLREIEAPSLILCGAEDTSTTPEMARELARCLPAGSYQEIPDAGHLPCVEHPAVVALAMERFVTEAAHA